MAETKHWYLICYDIRDPKRWRKAFKLLKGYGESVQLSIFRCHLSERLREKLRWELEQILEKEDRLLLVGLCGRCADRITTYNREETWKELPGFQIF
ncbi:CRISPR-associated endonuclease Cas2 [Gloeomargaritales cyanobacterium VI4D9]|jgi:CRISPR-associated protein Cas2|nr:CRISPR-associated endonuclease Cas2 [Gloeomargaritales cyanobacterium VI4D9]